jgi:hypothetical protein
MRKGGRAARRLVEEMSLPRSGSQLPSLNVGQDNCGNRLGQQPQSVPKVTLDWQEIMINIRRAPRLLTLPTSPALTVDKLTELRDVISAHLSGSASESSVLGVLRDFTIERRAHGDRAEKVVIALKLSWESLADERMTLSREKQLQLIDRLVTRCIDEYYKA